MENNVDNSQIQQHLINCSSSPPPNYQISTCGYLQQPTAWQNSVTPHYRCNPGNTPKRMGGYVSLANDEPEIEIHAQVQQVVPSSDTTVVMSQPSVVLEARVPYVDDHMCLSVIGCLFFCCIFGTFAIMKSYEAKRRNLAGDYRGAVIAAKNAKGLAVASIVGGVVITICFGLYLEWIHIP